MFPVSVGGQVCTRRVVRDPDTIIRNLRDELEKYGLNLVVEGRTIRFRNDGFQWSFSRFAAVGSGRFELKETTSSQCVEYNFSHARLVFLVGVIVAFFAVVLVPGRSTTLVEKLSILSAFCAEFYGLNYALLWGRNYAMLRRLLG